MAVRQESTRQRLIQAAIQLFIAQGVTETTTRQIAELADVNEVTLFRQFGNKHGLLLAVIEDTKVFTQLSATLGEQAIQTDSVSQALKNYSSVHLQALVQIQEFVRSLIGEAGQYPLENRRALGKGVTLANRHTAQYLATVIRHEQLQTHLPTEKLASLLNSLLLGYAVLEFTSEVNDLWQDREHFIDDLVELFLYGAIAHAEGSSHAPTLTVNVPSSKVPPIDVKNLPASLVHSILRQAKKNGLQDYAIAYVLFGAGLSVREVISLERSHSLSDAHQHVLRVNRGSVRQLPVNHWILGQRYGSYQHNPLTNWLKSRKDSCPALFIDEMGNPISEATIRYRWQQWTVGLLTLEGIPPAIEQSQHTWCVEMLMKGISLENLVILTGWDLEQLQPYVRRAREQAALEQAIRLDQKSSNPVMSSISSAESA